MTLLAITVSLNHSAHAQAATILVTGSENGRGLGDDYLLWHDPTGQALLKDAVAAFSAGAFAPPVTQGSLGLAPGAFWLRFDMRNYGSQPVELRLEYTDHQLVYLRAYQRSAPAAEAVLLADLALEHPFERRPVMHHRFVVPVNLAAGEGAEFYVQLRSHEQGFVFPQMRLWTPDALLATQVRELWIISLLTGGLLVMALIALVEGIATRIRFFYFYALHALASAAVWFTVFGFTHQFLITENYHWRYMSITGALSLLTGVSFARSFLNTRVYAPRFDYLLLFLIANSVFLLLSAVAEQSTLAVVSITLALLLYPAVSLAGFIRWRQGAREAGIFTIAWTFMVVGLFTQALRDLGVVPHTVINYYWPAVASFGEMAVILIATGVRIRDLRSERDIAERIHLARLESVRDQLEMQVAERTRDLESAKSAAEREARTDTLTGVNNRRSFMEKGQGMLARSRREGLSLSLLMLDLDHFKSVNDQFGHATGDRALKAFASAVSSIVRERDVFGRIGGEEFALLLISPLDAAMLTAERIREQAGAIALLADDEVVRFTTSIGVAEMSDETELEQLIKRADEALYRAKTTGRNRIEHFSAAPLDAEFGDSAPE